MIIRVVYAEQRAAGEVRRRHGYMRLMPARLDEEACWLYSRDDLRRADPDLDVSLVLPGHYVESDHAQKLDGLERADEKAHAPLVDERWLYAGGILVRRLVSSAAEDARLPYDLEQLDAFLRLDGRACWTHAYGGRWRLLLNALLERGGSGEAGGKRHATLRAHFWDAEDDEPVPGKLKQIEFSRSEQIHTTCDACGLPRLISKQSATLGWNMGRVCAAKLEALEQGCGALFEVRTEGRTSLPCLPLEWLTRKRALLDAVHAHCMQANAMTLDLD